MEEFQLEAPSRRLRRHLSIVGYVIDDDSVGRVDALASRLIGASEATAGSRIEYLCTLADSESVRFANLPEMLNYCRHKRMPIKALRSTHEAGQIGLGISYRQTGEVIISAYGAAPDLEFNVDRIVDELSNTVQEYPWWVRRLLLRRWPIALFAVAAFVFSLGFLADAAFYLYGLRVGINIDQEVAESVPLDLEYMAAVSDALKSDDITTKLDALLYGELQNFRTLDQWLIDRRRELVFLFSFTLAAVVLLLLSIKMYSLYPRAFFAIGRSRIDLENLQRKRDLWEAAVIAAFIVNLIAGLIIAFISR